ncbi:MAG: UDP-N-acetylmuramoyl-L-alanyl-D-glutamate--2,6-diaminopimelate ligase [Spirochaetes bacterium]|nr:UDP-N-acetylmuramoyl-L-alanyl-D-glutamate--2,6-diaminopimelate ligase [Spirochaetota bacterium]
MERLLSEFFTQETAAKAGFSARDGDADPVITGLEYDSRKVMPGNMYFALAGLHTDGHLYIEEALQRGAAAVVHEPSFSAGAGQSGRAVFLCVKDSRFSMSPVAAAFYGHPSRRLRVAGVTGTEGKSTTSYLIWQLLTLLGKKAGLISTVQYSVDGKSALWNSEHQTTPEATVVQRLLREMEENGCEYAVVESSSHGLSPRTNRLGDVFFRCAVITNLKHEHLEFHGSWEQYRDDKANLFRALDICAQQIPSSAPFGVINADDASASYFAKATKQKNLTFSTMGKEAHLSLQAVESSAWGNWYSITDATEDNEIISRDKLPGAFNAGNVFAALLVVSGFIGLKVRELARFIPSLKPVRGRMNSVDKGQPFEVIVDYAHTPSSFEAIFPSLRYSVDKTGGRIISVFGSPGERDTIKRGEQGKVAAMYSDTIILADEDPRGEEPVSILEEIAQAIETPPEGGVYKADFKRGENLFLIPDRKLAVRKAFSLAQPKDMVLLLGKGHENSIIYADHVMPYDEIEEAQKALSEIGY